MSHTVRVSRIALCVALCAGLSTVAHAQQPIGAEPTRASGPEQATDAPIPPVGDDIVVLGTRRTDRTLTNSASPVDVISSAELNAQPAANMLDQIKNIVPSFYVGQNTISDASTFVRSASLRGLPGDEVLVMLNGKRYNRSALVQVYGGSDSGLSFGSQGPTSRRSRRSRSATCRCCATAPPRNTGRTPSRAC